MQNNGYSIIDMVCNEGYDILKFEGVTCMNENVNEQHLLNLGYPH